MTKEERSNIARLIRRETCCGLMEATIAVDKLIYALKHGPSVIMDKPRELEVTWKERIDSDISDAFQLGRENMKEQMMNEAVEADVNIYRDLTAGKSWAEFVVEMPTNNLGDKVRLIIVKED